MQVKKTINLMPIMTQADRYYKNQIYELVDFVNTKQRRVCTGAASRAECIQCICVEWFLKFK